MDVPAAALTVIRWGNEVSWQSVSVMVPPTAQATTWQAVLPGYHECDVASVGADLDVGSVSLGEGHGSVFRRCGCRDQSTSRLLGASCPGLRSRSPGTCAARRRVVALGATTVSVLRAHLAAQRWA